MGWRSTSPPGADETYLGSYKNAGLRAGRPQTDRAPRAARLSGLAPGNRPARQSRAFAKDPVTARSPSRCPTTGRSAWSKAACRGGDPHRPSPGPSDAPRASGSSPGGVIGPGSTGWTERSPPCTCSGRPSRTWRWRSCSSGADRHPALAARRTASFDLTLLDYWLVPGAPAVVGARKAGASRRSRSARPDARDPRPSRRTP